MRFLFLIIELLLMGIVSGLAMYMSPHVLSVGMIFFMLGFFCSHIKKMPFILTFPEKLLALIVMFSLFISICVSEICLLKILEVSLTFLVIQATELICIFSVVAFWFAGQFSGNYFCK